MDKKKVHNEVVFIFWWEPNSLESRINAGELGKPGRVWRFQVAGEEVTSGCNLHMLVLREGEGVS